MKKILMLIAFFSAIIVFNCSSEKRSFERACSENTVAAYENFLKEYPESIFKDSVDYQIEKIYFTEAQNKDSINIYIDFLRRYPDNNFTGEVKKLLEKKGQLITLKQKEFEGEHFFSFATIEGLSQGPNRYQIWYCGLSEAEGKPSKSLFRIGREGEDKSYITRIDSISGNVGQVLESTSRFKVIQKGQTLGFTEYDVYGRPKRTTTLPTETFTLTVKLAIISANDSTAEILILPETKIISKKQ